MNISFMQNGGGMPPFTYYQPVLINNTSPERYSGSNKTDSAKTTTSKKSNDKEDGFGKIAKLVNALKGLPSDLDLIQNQVSTLLQLAQYGASPGELDAMYAKTAFEIKKAQFSQTKYENVEEYARKVDSLTEMAITPEGGLLVKDRTKKNPEIETVSISKYLQNKNKYMHVTNQELLELRAKKQPKNDKLLDIVNNGTSLIAIDKLINQYLDQLGTNYYEGTGTSRTQQGKIIQGIEFVQNALNRAAAAGIPIDGSGLVTDGLYEAKLITKEQKIQADQALEYIKRMLPKNMKTYLLATVGNEKDVVSILENFVYSKTNREVQFDPKLQKEKDDDSKSGKKSGDKNDNDNVDVKSNLYTNIVANIGGSKSSFTLRDNLGYSVSISATSYPLMQNYSGEPQKATSLSSFLENGAAALYKGGSYAITFGDKVLSPEDMQHVVYRNDHKDVRVILPIKVAATGEIVPDLNFVKENRDLIDLINKNGINDPQVKKALADTEYIDPYTGKVNINKFQVYFAANGIATDGSIEMGEFMTKVKDSSKYTQEIKTALQVKDLEGDVVNYEIDEYSWFNPLDWGENFDQVYEGIIYIPVTENQLQTQTGSDKEIKYEDAYQLESRYQKFDNARYAGETNSNVL